MTLDACIAHAIHSDLDIVSLLPEAHDLPVEDLEPYIEEYVTRTHRAIHEAILRQGEPYIRAQDPAGLCATLLNTGIHIPAYMLLRMCQTITQLSTLDAKFILDTEEGASLYYVKLALA